MCYSCRLSSEQDEENNKKEKRKREKKAKKGAEKDDLDKEPGMNNVIVFSRQSFEGRKIFILS